MSIRVEVWGDYACFSRPEMKVERVSYDVMTPSAARGLIEAVYWHPGLRWVIDRIHVCAPIRFTNIRRNEVKDVISAQKVRAVMERRQGELYLATPESIQQRAAMVLRNVRYVIDAHFDLVPQQAAPGDNPGKFQDIVKRRLSRGSTTTSPASACGSSPPSSRPARMFRPAPRNCWGSATWAGCCWTWTTPTPRTSAPCSSGPSCKTACWLSRPWAARGWSDDPAGAGKAL